MRIEGWEKKLDSVIERKRNQPFNWADNNCLGLVAEVQQEITGNTDFPEALEDVSSKFNAQRIILKNAKNLTEWVDNKLRRIPITMATRGDVVEVETPEGPAMGICVGAKAVFIGQDGLEYISLVALIRAWRV
jgi:hypothetical protein